MAEQENEQVSDQASSEIDNDEDPICSESASQVQVDQEYTQLSMHIQAHPTQS